LKSAQSAETNINTDRWISVDKGFHLVGSLISTIGMSKSCIRFAEIKQKKSIWIGAGLSFTFGLSKEIRDGYQPNNFFSWKDLSADIAGILIGVALLQID